VNYIIWGVIDMPKRARSLKRAQSQAAISARWSEKRVCHGKEEFSYGDFGGEMNRKVFENYLEGEGGVRVRVRVGG
jgi:hypothetical protein